MNVHVKQLLNHQVNQKLHWLWSLIKLDNNLINFPKWNMSHLNKAYKRWHIILQNLLMKYSLLLEMHLKNDW